MTDSRRGEDDFDRHIAQAIRSRRLARGLTKAALAAACGRDRNTVSNWEAMRTSPTAHDLARAAAALGCTPRQLLGCDPSADAPRYTPG